jgi:hypothetical protein
MKDEIVITSSGGKCYQCVKPTKVYWNRVLDKCYNECVECGRRWEASYKPFPAKCSCGCDHIEFSGIVGNTWHVHFGKCKHGDNITHVIERKFLQ